MKRWRFIAGLTLALLLGLGLSFAPAQAATQITSGYTAQITYADRALIRLSSGTLIMCCADTTNSKLRMFSSTNGTSWSEFSGTAPACYYTAALWTDGTNWYVAWYGDTTHVYYATGSSTAYPSGTSIATASITSSACDLAGCLDAGGCSHIVYLVANGSVENVSYINNVGGSWNNPVSVNANSSDGQIQLAIAIDTNSNDSNRYNLPQISYVDSTASTLYAALGNANKATSFTNVNPKNKSASQANAFCRTSITIDTNGQTSIAYYYNHSSSYAQGIYIPAASTWGTANNWTAETIIATIGYYPSSMVANGTDRYCFITYSSATYYSMSSNYGSWAAPTKLDAATAEYSKARWQYANNPSYSTYGIGYVYSDGTNIWYDNLSIATSITATLTASLSNLTASLTGNHGIAGTTSAALSNLTSSLSSTVIDFMAALSASLSNLTASLTGSEIAGTLSGTLSQVTGALTGNHGIAGTMSAALSNLTSSLNSTIIDFTAALSANLSNLTASLSGNQGVTATVTGAFSNLAASLAGNHGIAGTVSAALSQMGASLIAGHGVSGDMEGSLSQLAASLSATVIDYAAALDAALDQIAASLAGGHGVGAVVSAALDQLSGTLSGVHGVGGALLVDLDPLTADLKGTISGYVAQLAGNLDDLAASLAGSSVAASLNAALDQVIASFTGSSVAASLNAALDQIEASLTGGHGVGAVLSAAVAPFSAVFNGAQGVAARLAAALEDLAAAILGIFRLVAKGPVLVLSPENRQLALSPESRQLALSPESRQLALSPESRQLALSPQSRILVLPPYGGY